MKSGPSIDSVLVQWGERLFYPANRIVRTPQTPRLDGVHRRKAAVIRQRIEATVVRRAPQVMIKVTGGGRGMSAIAAHFRYISKNGKLEIEDDRGLVRDGKEALHDLVEQWRHGGSLIDDVGNRREAFNIMLSMPQGTDPQIVQKAAREFAHAELRGHRYVMVLHRHQTNPHVHLSVRAESMAGVRLNPRNADLHRWRETFAEKLRGWGVQAEATRQATRGATRHFDPIWRIKAKQDGRLIANSDRAKSGARFNNSRKGALEAWMNIARALQETGNLHDRELAQGIAGFLRDSAYLRQASMRPRREEIHVDRERRVPRHPSGPPRSRPPPDIER